MTPAEIKAHKDFSEALDAVLLGIRDKALQSFRHQLTKSDATAHPFDAIPITAIPIGAVIDGVARGFNSAVGFKRNLAVAVASRTLQCAGCAKLSTLLLDHA